MGLLRTEPEGVVESLPELMAIAKALEEESARRYLQLSQRMRSLDNKAAMEVFEHLAREEETHSARVVEMSLSVTGAAPKRAEIRWELPRDLEDEGMADLAVSYLVTPYRALSIAVRNEERAFAFWSYVSAYAPSESIRAYAERMAREELRHAAILRRERRTAYHDQPHHPRMVSSALSMAQLQEKAATLERGILEKCRALAAVAGDDQATANLLRKIAEETTANIQASGVPNFSPSAPQRQDAPDSVVILDRIISACEAAAEEYLQAAESAVDERVSLEAQQLSKLTIARLVALRGCRAELSPIQFEDEPRDFRY